MCGKMMSVQPANKTRGWGKLLVSLLGVMASVLTAAAGTLKWVGASGAAWNTTAQNWQDENGDPSAWVDGSIAEFGDDGGANIAASGTINLGGLVFKGTTRPTISGGTLHFAAQMPIDVNTYKGATISSKLTFADGFVANFVQPECAHPGFLTCRGYGTWDIYTGGTNTLWRNCRLEDLEIKSLYFHKVNSAGVIQSPLLAHAYNSTWTDGKLRIQFQYPSGALSNIDCVMLEFEQVGDDVTVKGMRIRSLKTKVNGELIKLGDDFLALDAAGLLSGGMSKIYDGVNTSGWCVYGSEIHVEPKGTLEFSGGWAHTNATTVIGDHVMLYQGVTLGAKNFKYDADGRPLDVPRHPVLEDNVTVYANTTILGRVTIGHDTVVGGNVWLTHDVPPRSRILQTRAVEQPLFTDGAGI